MQSPTSYFQLWPGYAILALPGPNSTTVRGPGKRAFKIASRSLWPGFASANQLSVWNASPQLLIHDHLPFASSVILKGRLGGGLEDLFSADYFFHLMFKAGFFFTHQLKPDFFFTKNWKSDYFFIVMFQVKDIHIIFRVEARLFFLQHIKAKKFFQRTGWAKLFFLAKSSARLFFQKVFHPPPQIMKWLLPCASEGLDMYELENQQEGTYAPGPSFHFKKLDGDCSW